MLFWHLLILKKMSLIWKIRRSGTDSIWSNIRAHQLVPCRFLTVEEGPFAYMINQVMTEN